MYLQRRRHQSGTPSHIYELCPCLKCPEYSRRTLELWYPALLQTWSQVLIRRGIGMYYEVCINEHQHLPSVIPRQIATHRILLHYHTPTFGFWLWIVYSFRYIFNYIIALYLFTNLGETYLVKGWVIITVWQSCFDCKLTQCRYDTVSSKHVLLCHRTHKYAIYVYLKTLMAERLTR